VSKISLGLRKRFLRNLLTILIRGLKCSATPAAKYEARVLEHVLVVLVVLVVLLL